MRWLSCIHVIEIVGGVAFASLGMMFGFLNCNKPIGFTSRDVVNVIQGQLRKRKIKVGHCGTLDPLADGVLVVGVGAAAKLVPYVHETSKCYVATFRLGAESVTGDLEVEPTVHHHLPIPTLDQMQSACQSLVGWIKQIPPAYSAVKLGGKRAYDLARQGKQVVVPERTVEVHEIKVRSYEHPTINLEITCGTGTYIRTLGMDMAKRAGTVAVMTSLRRTRVGEFKLADSASIDEIRNSGIEALLLPARLGVTHLPKRIVTATECMDLIHGKCLTVQDGPAAPSSTDACRYSAAITEEGHLQAILTEKSGRWCPKKVFPKKQGDQNLSDR